MARPVCPVNRPDRIDQRRVAAEGVGEHSPRAARIHSITRLHRGDELVAFTLLSARGLSTLALIGRASVVPGRTYAPTAHRMPGLSFRISSSAKIYPGDTPRSQDDEVMRGRGQAAGNHARIEFLAYTPAPTGVTTDDFVIALDSGKVWVQHVNGNRFTSANDTFGGPAVVTLGRVMGGGRGRGRPPGDAPGGGGGRGEGGRTRRC